MKKSRAILFAIALVGLSGLTGCAATPTVPQIESKHGDRVGIIVELSDNPVHTHVGTTVFNNFVKPYPYDWKLHDRVYETVKNKLLTAGLTPVDLKADGIKYTDVAGLIQSNAGKWNIGNGKEEAFRKLHDQMKLRAIVVLKEARVKTLLECYGGPCSQRTADKSGLFTRSMFNINSYYAVAGYEWHVYALDPIADTAVVNPLRSKLQRPVVLLSNKFRPDAASVGFQPPADFQHITEKEFAPVEEAILKFTDSVSGEVANSLSPK